MTHFSWTYRLPGTSMCEFLQYVVVFAGRLVFSHTLNLIMHETGVVTSLQLLLLSTIGPGAGDLKRVLYSD